MFVFPETGPLLRDPLFLSAYALPEMYLFGSQHRIIVLEVSDFVLCATFTCGPPKHGG